MKKKDLRNNIIKLDDFFRHTSTELKKKIGFTRVSFLVPDGKNGDFVTNNSSSRSSIRLTHKELCVIDADLKRDIYYTSTKFQCDCFYQRFMLLKIKWKFWLFGISAIMSIYYDGKFACLILFKDHFVNKERHCLKKIRQEITHCLESILLYNHTLEGIIRNHYRSTK